MAFDLYPDPPAAPLRVAAASGDPPAAVSPPFVFDERIGGDNRMFLRVAALSEGNPPPAAPTIAVAADTGDPVDVPLDFSEAPVFALPGRGGQQVASVRLVATESGGVHLIRLTVFRPGSVWSIRFTNPDPARPVGFTWVVADNEPQTRQPWIDVDTAARVEAFGTETVTARVRIANHGTGPLRLTDPAGTALGAGFVLSSIAPIEVAPGGNAIARISFTDTEPPGPGTTVHGVLSNDPAAREAAGHNRRVALTARKSLVRPGDILAVGKQHPPLQSILFRVDSRTGQATEVSSGGLFVSPTAVAVGPDGDIYVTDLQQGSEGGGIIRIDRFTGAQALVPTRPGEFRQPTTITFEKRGTIIAIKNNFGTGPLTIARVDTRSGDQSALASGPPLSQPMGVAIDGEGNVLVADMNAFGDPGGVIRIDPVTGVQSRLFAASGPFFDPSSLAVLPNGHIIAAGFKRLVDIDPVTGQAATVADDLFPGDLAVETTGALIVAAHDEPTGGVRIVRLDPSGGNRSTLHVFAAFFMGMSITVVPPRDSAPG